MTTKKPLLGMLVATGIVLAGQSSSAEPVGRRIEVWVRETGDYDTNPHLGKRARQRIDLVEMQGTDVVRWDPQYERDRHYRGVELTAIIRRYQPPPEVDAAILHFSNGMAVPVPFRDRQSMARIDAFVAIAMRASVGNGAWSARFPEIAKKDSGEDVRPITFGANKLAVRGRWHPIVPEAAEAVFSPWSHADTLVGIELVRAAAYYRQYDVDGSPAALAGLERFKESCQFCHGVHQTGATFGWDLVDPIPLYKLNAKQLSFHVRNSETEAARRGLMMPALTHLSAKDTRDLWHWLRAIGTRPINPYVP